MSTLVGHFVSSPREREKRARRDSRGELEEIVEEMKERDRGERGKLMKVKTQMKLTIPLHPYLLKGQQALPNGKPISVGRPGDAR